MKTESKESHPQSAGHSQGSAISRLVFWFLLALVFLLPLKFGNPVATQSSQYPPRTVLEWILTPWLGDWFVAAVFVLAALSGLAQAFDKRPGTSLFLQRRRGGVVLTVSLAVFPVFVMASTPVSTNISVTLDTLFMLIACVLLAHLVSSHVRTHRQRMFVLTALLCGTAVVCWSGIVQRFVTFSQLPSWDEIYRVVGTGPEAAHVARKYADKRIFSTFVYPNTLGGFLVMAFPVVLAALWRWRGKFTREAFVILVALVAAVGLALLGLTKSNGSFLALGGSLVATLLLWQTSWKRKLLIALVGLAILGAFFGVAYGKKRVSGGLLTLEKRLAYWNAAVDLAAQRPILGWGPGVFGDHYVRYIRLEEFNTGGSVEEPRMAHNGFLQIAADSGLPATSAFAVIWLAAIIGAARLYQQSRSDPEASAVWLAVFAGLVAWTVHEFVDFDLYVPGVGAIAFVLVGMVLAAQTRPVEPSPESPATAKALFSHSGARVASVCSAVVLFFIAAWFIRDSMANYDYTEARDLVADGRVAEALAPAQQAVRGAPLDASYWSFLGDIQGSLGQFQEAEASYRTATIWANSHASFWHDAAMARWRRLGRPDSKVMYDLSRAAELYPSHPRYRKALEQAQQAE